MPKIALCHFDSESSLWHRVNRFLAFVCSYLFEALVGDLLAIGWQVHCDLVDVVPVMVVNRRKGVVRASVVYQSLSDCRCASQFSQLVSHNVVRSRLSLFLKSFRLPLRWIVLAFWQIEQSSCSGRQSGNRLFNFLFSFCQVLRNRHLLLLVAQVGISVSLCLVEALAIDRFSLSLGGIGPWVLLWCPLSAHRRWKRVLLSLAQELRF